VFVDKVYGDKVWRRAEEEKAAEEEPGIQNQKQEPHTKMWGNKRPNAIKCPISLSSGYLLLSLRYFSIFSIIPLANFPFQTYPADLCWSLQKSHLLLFDDSWSTPHGMGILGTNEAPYPIGDEDK